MVKRKLSKAAKHSPQSHTISGSDSDPEPSPEMLKTNQPSRSFCSTPCGEFLSSFIGPTAVLTSSEDESLESSHSATNVSNYEDFISFLKSFSLASGSEAEEEKQSSLRQTKSTSGNQSPSLSETKYSQECYFQQKRAYESCQSRMETSMLGTRIIIVPSKNLEIVSLQHPASLTLHGYLKMSVLIGRISILGYTIDEGKGTRVFSSEKTTLLKASTLKSTHLSSIKRVQKKLKRVIRKDQTADLNDFLEQVGPGTVVIVLQKCTLSPSLQFLENYFPNAVQTHKVKKKPSDENGRLCSAQEDNAFTISSDYETISEEIKKAFLSISEADFGPRIIAYGSKRSGKSSLLRYLINRALNEFPAVYYLDIDPGQTEFTPAGVVSLIKVTKPLLGPPYSHQRNPLKMIFTGSISAETSPPMYIKSVLSLIETFTAKFSQEILFVNTMGWIQGIGGMCFQSVMKALNPNMLIEFVAPDKLPEMKKEILTNGTTSFQIPAVEHSNLIFATKDMRNFALMAYFGKCQKFYKDPTYLNTMRPVIVSWDKFAVYVMGKNVPPSRLIEAIHCSIVGLCRVDRSYMMESDNPELPRTLFDEPINECIGFGIVRATDETNHLLYIVTSLSVEELKPVNAIIKGNILLPDAVYLNQGVRKVSLPYIDCSKAAPTAARKMIRKRHHSLMHRTPIKN